MRTTGRRDTPPELRVRSLLHRNGYRFRVDLSPVSATRSRADIVFARLKVAVYVDGCFWHACPLHGTWPKANADWWRSKIESNWIRDRKTDAALRASGWLVVRIWEHDEPVDALSMITAALQTRSARFDGVI
jgi:DNA mismatch endonuclease (patch repair protein)